jgi:hypothetical protein
VELRWSNPVAPHPNDWRRQSARNRDAATGMGETTGQFSNNRIRPIRIYIYPVKGKSVKIGVGWSWDCVKLLAINSNNPSENIYEAI